MLKKLPIVARFAILLLLIFLQACDQKSATKVVEVDPGFSAYINGFTSGVIGSQSTIKILFNQAIPGAQQEASVPTDLLTFHPPLAGNARWQDAQTLVFYPDAPLPSGAVYLAELQLHQLLEVPKAFQTLHFNFSILQQSISLTSFTLFAPEITQPERVQLQLALRTNDFSLPNLMEQCLQIQLNDKALSATWNHEANGREHALTTASIERLNHEQFVQIRWDGSPLGSDSKGEETIRIPPLGEFTLQQVNIHQQPQLHIALAFSDPIQADQELQGLVYLASGVPLRLEAEGNIIRAWPKRGLKAHETLHIHSSLRNSLGHQLQSNYVRPLQLASSLPNVERIDDGVIMPARGQTVFPFRAVNLKAVNLRIIRIFAENVPQFLQVNAMDGDEEISRVGRMIFDGQVDLVSNEAIDYGQWNTFAIDLNQYIQQEPGAIYRVLIGFERAQSLYPCGGDEEIVKLQKHQPQQDRGGYYYDNWGWYEGEMDWREKDNPCADSYYLYWDRGISANLISSSLGMVAKQSEEELYDVFVTDLNSTEPIAGVQVEAFNYQQQSLGSASTNAQGMARIRSGERPYLLLAQRGKERAYLRVDPASSLSLSLFETRGSEVKKGIKGFVYGERGVWRPGDSLHIGFLLDDPQASLPPSHPVRLEVSDPRGKLCFQQSLPLGENQHCVFHFPTAQDAPTGLWRAKVTVGTSVFYKSLRIESIKPNRLRIAHTLPEVIPAATRTTHQMQVHWLYGAPGSQLKLRVEAELQRINTKFESYDDFRFDDLSKPFYAPEPIVTELTTDAQGKVSYALDLPEIDDAPGMLQLRLATKIFEAGGDFSQDYLNQRYSPYTSYAGLRFSGGAHWGEAINTAQEQSMMLAAVDANGRPLSKKLLVSIYKLRWNWWWEGEGSADQYLNSRSSELLWEGEADVQNGKSAFSLQLSQPCWGKLLIRVSDPESGHSASQLVFAEYPGWAEESGETPEAAAILKLESQKPSYQVGDEVVVRWPSGSKGRLLVTLEKGDRLLKQIWMPTEEGLAEYRFKATEEMSPNVYVSAHLIQPHQQQANSLPIRMYGVIPITIENPNTHLHPQIEAPQEVRPESTFNVTVSEKTGRAMSYTLAVVDEGLLSLTRFETPDPWKAFHQKEALGVRSWDLYRFVMNARTAGLHPLLATGGDQALDFKDMQEVNRFKPVVRYYGPFFLKAGKKASHPIPLPNYLGAVRVMVVAGSNGAFGHAEKEVQVKQPLMVLSTLPRVLGPSEEIVVPVQVMAMNDALQKVKVRVKNLALLERIGPAEQEIQFSKSGEQTVYFRFKVAQQLGAAKIRVEVEGGGFQAFEETSVQVRPANPRIAREEYALVEVGQSWSTTLNSPGLRGTEEAQLSVSPFPDLGIQKHLAYLIQYPHGCIEQTTSAVFPQLFLHRLSTINAAQGSQIQDNVRAALQKLRSFQTTYGGFSYWPGQSQVSTWGTNYAGHFMLEAQLQGYDLPVGLREQWLRFQKEEAAKWSRRTGSIGYDQTDLIQAYRLYTLALAQAPDLGAMNRLRNDPLLSNKAAWRLAAAYALVGQTAIAQEMVKLDPNREAYTEMGNTYGSSLRDLAMCIETLGYLKEYSRAAPWMQELARELNHGWHSTQTRAYALLAFAKLLGDAPQQNEYAFNLQIDQQIEKVNAQTAAYVTNLPKSALQGKKLAVSNTSPMPLFLSLTQSGIPLEDKVEEQQSDLLMKVQYFNLQGQPIEVKQIQQGADFKAVVQITHPGIRGNYEEMALEQIFPSGWQIVNRRVNGEATPSQNLDYQDLRDDRVFSYFDLPANKTITVEVLLNATFAGKFYQPAIRCSAMYDHSVQAVKKGGWIEVVAQ